ncbi:DUF2341 domain-containing protein [Patescibacteria group bacterium]|nr:DUF2341 domain-containing protein [Patescibacteria group bacterium]
MIKDSQEKRRFSRLEILAYILIIFLLFLAIFLFVRGLLAEARDRERIANIKILEEGLENYFEENEKYPQVSEWECLEKDVQSNGKFWQEMKNYLPEIPRDPFYDPSHPIFCYHYKSTDQGKEYKLYTTLEKKKIYQVYSGGGELIFTGKLGEGPWYNSDWKFRKKIKIFQQKVAGDLENFPVLVYLKDEDLRERAKPAGVDILFVSSDGKTLLLREIEKYDSQTGELVAWVKVPSVSATGDTEIYIYYGSSKTIQVNEKDTWEENFLAVYHFNEISGTTTDTTSNGNDGTPEGKLTQGAEGKIFRGAKFDGKDDYINLGAEDSFYEMESLTFQAWVFPEGESEDDKIFGLDGAEYKKRGIFGWEGSDYGPWQLVTSLSETSFGSGYQEITSENPLELNQWNFVAGAFGEDEMILFINGEKTSQELRYKEELRKGKEKFAEIGRYYRESLISDSKVWRSYSFSGILDEVRISKVARPLSWIETSFQNQKDPATFIELGAEELY